MKAFDLHIHTVDSISDNGFEFNMNVLKEYIVTQQLDVIAITNHNLFNIEQYYDICQELEQLNVIVFPGVEVDLEGGHMLVICPKENVESFDKQCKSLEHKIHTAKDSIDLKEFKTIFPDFNKYLLIPHYDKKPRIKESVLEALSNDIIAGEVKSYKKFLTMKKDYKTLVPVLFSDFRPDNAIINRSDKGDLFPVRKTYLKVEDVSIPNIKTTLMDRTKVFANEKGNEDEFVITKEGVTASTGLNVVLGERASGKSYLLNSINNTFYSTKEKSVKYIKQFYISSQSDEKSFDDLIKKSYEDISEAYLSPLKPIIKEIISFDPCSDEASINEYLDSLKENAKTQSQSNIFSSTKIFNEPAFDQIKNQEIASLLKSLMTLIDNHTYRKTISKYLDFDMMKLLFLDLLKKYRVTHKEYLLKEKTDETLNKIKDELEVKSTISRIKPLNLLEIIMHRKISERFNELVRRLMKGSPLNRLNEDYHNYLIEVSKDSYENISTLKKRAGINHNIKLDNIYKEFYGENPTRFVIELYKENIPESDLHKVLIDVNIQAKTIDGTHVSGGQKAELILLKELADATDFDILLIDEPESSFDNLFIKESIISRIKDVSKRTTVFLSTHNNTLGVSINPDRIIHTKKIGHDEYDIFTGTLSSNYLVNTKGEKLKNFETILNTMEAGSDAYKERNKIYENLKN